MTKRKRTSQPRNQSGLLPGESRRRSLVTIQEVNFGQAADRSGLETRNYIVESRHLDGEWTHRVEYKGQEWLLPGKVVERILAQRDAIITAERRQRAVERATALLSKGKEYHDNPA